MATVQYQTKLYYIIVTICRRVTWRLQFVCYTKWHKRSSEWRLTLINWQLPQVATLHYLSWLHFHEDHVFHRHDNIATATWQVQNFATKHLHTVHKHQNHLSCRLTLVSSLPMSCANIFAFSHVSGRGSFWPAVLPVKLVLEIENPSEKLTGNGKLITEPLPRNDINLIQMSTNKCEMM